mmetsp:Transcript_4428/g.13428  ORF Transcript_4428/g.13428 Transcript_4428/m.13428 type:complete len:218 (-) Transcript_4428:277-930(-)
MASSSAATAEASPPTVLEQVEQAEQYKQKGNGHFKEADYRKALGSYHRVFCFVNGLQVPGEGSEAASYGQMMGKSSPGLQVPAEKVEDLRLLKQSTYLNMAACYLKLDEYDKCITTCTKAMSGSEPNSKAHFRRGQAHLAMRNLDEAKADLELAKQLVPEDAACDKELRKLKQAFKDHAAKEKQTFAKMFSSKDKDRLEEELPVCIAVEGSLAATAE